MIDISQLTSLVSAFRVETEKESISPETVGKLLQDIVDLLATGDREVEMHDFYIPAASQGSAGVMTATHVKQLDALRQAVFGGSGTTAQKTYFPLAIEINKLTLNYRSPGQVPGFLLLVNPKRHRKAQ